MQVVSISMKPSSYAGVTSFIHSKQVVNSDVLLTKGMTEEMHKDVMDSMYTRRKRLTDENPSVASNVGNTTMDTVNPLDPGPWMIRNSLIILKKWSMDTILCKEELTRILVWVKIHDVPIQVFSEDSFSITTSQIGKPIMLDYYTTSMCIESWGISSFSYCLIEINADDVLKESLTIGVPLIEGTAFTIETVSIEYEWKPPRCDLCKIFGYVQYHCLKKVSITPAVVTFTVATPTVENTNDGFQTKGKNKKKQGKSKSTNGVQFSGHSIKQSVRYEPKATTSAPKKGATNVGNASKSSSMLKTTTTSTMQGNIPMSNPYFALDDESDEEVENVYDESADLFQSKKTDGSSFNISVLIYFTGKIKGLDNVQKLNTPYPWDWIRRIESLERQTR
uniref:Zinc knuckle CX2CX4HX4C n=1 Tax=Tanacetum cinerariifolium TaxID=118510 RepID=A0A699IPP7_TANCI|nr:zinc knuckle CX2CX4HX4C [Tanacetum cinerariifolium]